MGFSQGSEPPVAVKVAVTWLAILRCKVIPRVIRYHLPSVVIQVREPIVPMGTEAVKRISNWSKNS